MSPTRVVEPDSTAIPSEQTPPPRRRSWGKVFLVTMLASLIAWGGYWWSQHKYEYIPKRWGVVVPGKIYRSGQLTPQMLGKMLTKHGITAVIDLQLNDIHDVNQQAEVQYAKENGLSHFRFGLGGDGTGELKYYIDAVATVIQCVRDDQPMLVHCAAGTQRTGSVLACYRLLSEKADRRDVYEELREYDWDPQEDTELREYLNRHLPEIARQLVERGLLEEVPVPMPQLDE